MRQADRDLLLALGVMAAGALEVALGGGTLGAAVLGAVAAATLAWRRRLPALPLLGLAVLAALDDPLGASWLDEQNVPMAILILAAYGLGAHAGRRAAVAALLVALAGFAAQDLAAGADAAGPWLALVVVMPWLAGRAVGAQRTRAARLAAVARSLAAEPDSTAALEVARERERLAAESHVTIGHAVTTMVVQAGGARATLAADPARAHDGIAAIETTGRTAVDELRRTLRLLRTSAPAPPEPSTPVPAAAPGRWRRRLRGLAGGPRPSPPGLRVVLTAAAVAATLAAPVAAVAGGGDGYDAGVIVALLAVPWTAAVLAARARRQGRELAARTAELRRRQHARARLAVAGERARVARELHDAVAHAVSVMVLQAGGARSMLLSDPVRAAAALEAVESVGRAAMADLSRLAGDAAADRDTLPTLARLDALLDAVRAAGLAVDVRTEGRPVPLTPAVDATAFRLVQEGLTNAVKHAGTAPTAVTLRYGSDALGVEIVDQGDAGDAAGDAGGGHGLVGMRERAAAHGGRLEAGPEPGGGFAVRVRLPQRPEASA
jgi:signal transduction histidine kinase